jgi:hypothetical protein
VCLTQFLFVRKHELLCNNYMKELMALAIKMLMAMNVVPPDLLSRLVIE